jgi:hypothetical protein
MNELVNRRATDADRCANLALAASAIVGSEHGRNVSLVSLLGLLALGGHPPQ